MYADAARKDAGWADESAETLLLSMKNQWSSCPGSVSSRGSSLKATKANGSGRSPPPHQRGITAQLGPSLGPSQTPPANRSPTPAMARSKSPTRTGSDPILLRQEDHPPKLSNTDVMQAIHALRSDVLRLHESDKETRDAIAVVRSLSPQRGRPNECFEENPSGMGPCGGLNPASAVPVWMGTSAYSGASRPGYAQSPRGSAACSPSGRSVCPTPSAGSHRVPVLVQTTGMCGNQRENSQSTSARILQGQCRSPTPGSRHTNTGGLPLQSMPSSRR